MLFIGVIPYLKDFKKGKMGIKEGAQSAVEGKFEDFL